MQLRGLGIGQGKRVQVGRQGGTGAVQCGGAYTGKDVVAPMQVKMRWLARLDGWQVGCKATGHQSIGQRAYKGY